MQQTELYKLNKPGIDDPIAIAPLNENADKLEAALAALSLEQAAANQRQGFYKLFSATPEAGTREMEVDFSGIDLTQYGALVLFYSIYDSVNTPSMNINGVGGLSLIPGVSHATSHHHGGGFAVLIPDKERIYGVCLRATFALSSTTGGIDYAMFPVRWEEVQIMKFKPISDQSTVVFYGLRF